MGHDRASAPRRKPTIRLVGHNYREPGLYFVTLCTQGRNRMFGMVANGQMCLNDIGEMFQEMWLTIPEKYPDVELDARIIMPDHLHGVLMLGTEPDVEAPSTLGDVVKFFKGTSTHRYIKEREPKG